MNTDSCQPPIHLTALTPSRFWRRLGWWLMLLLALFAAGNAVLFMLTDWVGGRDFRASLRDPFWLGAVHTLGGALAILIGPFQFVERFRRQRPTWHRYLGQLYLCAVFSSASAGIFFALRPAGGAIAGTGLFALALCWITSGLIAWRFARKRQFAQHRWWMQINYAMTFAAASLRIELGLLIASGLSFMQAFSIVGWSSWLGNLLVLFIAKAWLSRTIKPH